MAVENSKKTASRAGSKEKTHFKDIENFEHPYNNSQFFDSRYLETAPRTEIDIKSIFEIKTCQILHPEDKSQENLT